jgi:hypothetical protein
VRGTFDHRAGGYVLSAEDEQKRRRAEATTAPWRAAHPYVDAEYGCDWCGHGVIWTAENFYEEFGRVPLSVDQAREHEGRCEWCAGDPAEPPRIASLQSFSLYRPGAGDDEPPLLEWDAPGYDGAEPT